MLRRVLYFLLSYYCNYPYNTDTSTFCVFNFIHRYCRQTRSPTQMQQNKDKPFSFIVYKHTQKQTKKSPTTLKTGPTGNRSLTCSAVSHECFQCSDLPLAAGCALSGLRGAMLFLDWAVHHVSISYNIKQVTSMTDLLPQ